MVTVSFCCLWLTYRPVKGWGRKPANMNKHNVNKALIYYLFNEIWSWVTEMDLHLLWLLFNTKINKSHDATLPLIFINSHILFSFFCERERSLATKITYCAFKCNSHLSCCLKFTSASNVYSSTSENSSQQMHHLVLVGKRLAKVTAV